MDDARRKELMDLLEAEARAKGTSNAADIDRMKKAFDAQFGWAYGNPHAAIDEENVKRFVAFELKR
jgi:hypothetical protein